MENGKAKEHRRQIALQRTDSGGGIDPESGYSMRAIVTKPWIDLKRPFPLDSLPNQTTFIAGIDAAPAKRLPYERGVKQREADVHYTPASRILTAIVMITLVVLILYVVWRYRGGRSKR